MTEAEKEDIRGRNGGTTDEDREGILDSFGYRCETRKRQSLDDIAAHIEKGEGAIITVDHRVLQKQSDVRRMSLKGIDHALTITGVEKDAKGRVVGLWIHDTGVSSDMGNAFYCSARDYKKWRRNPSCSVQYISKK